MVNDRDTLDFYFDTGATSTLIDSSVAERLGIKSNYKQSVEGAGGKKTYQLALNQQIGVGGIKLDSIHLILEDLTRLKEALNYPFDGIIGYPIMDNYLTEVNFEDKVIRLFDKDTVLDTSAFKTYDFTFDNGIPIPQLDVSIETNNSQTYKGKIFFDSGAGLTLLVNSPFNKTHNLSSQADKRLTSSSDNLSVESTSEKIAIKSLTLGDYTFTDLPIDLSYDTSGVSSYKGYLGILGSEIIDRFNYILDYKNKKLYLKPNQLYKKPFEFPLTGFSITEKEGMVVVSKVSPEGPAYQKGIRQGDVLISVNGATSSDLKSYENQLKKEGEKVQLQLKNKEGEVKNYELELNRLL